jgi:peptidoglycan/LPS O-acetylase OafA/YrhL
LSAPSTHRAGDGRLQSVDVARGLAALSVAIYHFGIGSVLARLTGWGALNALSWPGSQAAVPLFFVISGFCIHLGGLARPPSPGSAGRFLTARFFRIYPPWLFAVLLSAIVYRLGGAWPRPGLILTHVTLVNGFFDDYSLNPVLWSVSVEFCLYLLYPSWLSLRRRTGLGPAAAAAFAVSAASCLATALVHPEVSGPALWFFPNVWCGWIAGAVLAEMVHGGGLAPLAGARFWAAGVAAFALQALLVHLGAYTGILVYLRLPVMICLAVWPLSLFLLAGEYLSLRRHPWIALGWRGLVRIGLCSYSLYLIHMPIEALRFPLNGALDGGRILKGLLYASWIFVVIGAAWMSYVWIEVPSVNLGRRFLALRATASAKKR